MKSTNFEFLSPRWSELAELGAFAEAYTFNDPTSAIIKLRLFAENMTKDIYRDLKLPRPEQLSFIDYLTNDTFKTITPKVVLNKFHSLRINGNKAAHGELSNSDKALFLLQEAFDLARWLYVQFEKGDPQSIQAFQNPQLIEQGDSKAELKKQKKQALEKLAIQEARMESLLQELEEVRQKAETAQQNSEELQALLQTSQQSADRLEFNEAETRQRIIDLALAEVGWKIDQGDQSTDQVGKEVEVPDQPTDSGIGYADYVLWNDDHNPLAVIEAKRTSQEPERGRHQAKLYADGLESKYGQRPVIFYTNGYETWIWDDSQGYPPRKIYGFYSKDSLQYLVLQRNQKVALNTLESRENIHENRYYQVEAIRRVTERFSDFHRKALIVQATGTGKTRVAIAISELLIRAGWVKRVLFLCDRKELRKQAKNNFNRFLDEPLRIVNSRLKNTTSERIFLATYPAMQRIYQSFDVGFFDLIIADESHRSIYNVYRDLFEHFDCLQVGLTATPADYITRNTYRMFNCEPGVPTAYYGLEQAVDDKFLTPFEVFEHTTQFLREGIQEENLTQAQIQELEEQGEDPADYDFAPEVVDKLIFNRDTNRILIRNLMENGLRDAANQTLGKSIIFARNHRHAVLLRELFDEMYPQYGGRFCQVIDNYDPRAEQLIDDFKGQGRNDELTIAISVDMLDTGIDVPEIVNLDFAKPIRSPIKFWQMIGRGTRLCKNLFGPGKDKSIFRIFDHWGNFERFGMDDFRPAEPSRQPSLMEDVFNARLNLAETARRKGNDFGLNLAINLIHSDINSLPTKSIQIKDQWRVIQSVSDIETLKDFAPNTLITLQQEIGPLMQWRDIRGAHDAYQLDRLIARLQNAVLNESNEVEDLKIILLDWIASLPMHLNPVREKEAVITQVRSDEFWVGITIEDLESVRDPLRQIMHHRLRQEPPEPQQRVIDVTETEQQIITNRRTTNLRTIDEHAFQQVVEEELKKHFDHPVMEKIRKAERINTDDIETLASLILVQSPNASKDVLQEFFDTTVEELIFGIRQAVGMDHEAIEKHFAQFVNRHPSLSAKQTRFLGLLKNHIARYGSITIDKLYDQPFTKIDSDGPDGIFQNPKDLDELINELRIFQPPSTDNPNIETQ